MEYESVEARKFPLIFPGLALEDLTSKNTQALLKDAKTRFPFLGGTKEFTSSNADEFKAQLVPFISSQRTENHWQVVQFVKIFVKSDLLKDGVCLVDFPVGGDSKAAQESNTNNGMDQLDALMVRESPE